MYVCICSVSINIFYVNFLHEQDCTRAGPHNSNWQPLCKIRRIRIFFPISYQTCFICVWEKCPSHKYPSYHLSINDLPSSWWRTGPGGGGWGWGGGGGGVKHTQSGSVRTQETTRGSITHSTKLKRKYLKRYDVKAFLTEIILLMFLLLLAFPLLLASLLLLVSLLLLASLLLQASSLLLAPLLLLLLVRPCCYRCSCCCWCPFSLPFLGSAFSRVPTVAGTPFVAGVASVASIPSVACFSVNFWRSYG